MKFTNSFSVFLYASAVAAAPAVKRQYSPVQVIGASVDSVQSATNSNIATVEAQVPVIKNGAQSSADAVNAAVASITSSLKGITSSLQGATISIVGATTGAAGGIQKQATGLTQQQIDQLTTNIGTVQTVVKSLGAELTVSLTDLQPAAQKALASELTAISNAISPLVNPVLGFANAAKAFSANAGVKLDGLQTAYDGLAAVLQGTQKSLGLPQTTPPSYTAPTGTSAGNGK